MHQTNLAPCSSPAASASAYGGTKTCWLSKHTNTTKSFGHPFSYWMDGSRRVESRLCPVEEGITEANEGVDEGSKEGGMEVLGVLKTQEKDRVIEKGEDQGG